MQSPLHIQCQPSMMAHPSKSSTRKTEIGRCFKAEASLVYIRSFKPPRLHSKIVSKKSISQIHRYDFIKLWCVCWGGGDMSLKKSISTLWVRKARKPLLSLHFAKDSAHF